MIDGGRTMGKEEWRGGRGGGIHTSYGPSAIAAFNCIVDDKEHEKDVYRKGILLFLTLAI
jgi:hypothetical protein